MAVSPRAVYFLLYLSVSVLYIYVAPYNKVEESFNLQATHDILYHGFNLSAYDHKEFPGPVPRTFLGPLALAVAASPFRHLLPRLLTAADADAAEADAHSRLPVLYVVRALLAAAVAASLAGYTVAVGRAFGRPAAAWFAAITASQFHLLFYASRTLPNTFALALALPAAAALLLDGDLTACVRWGAPAALLFRSELALLLGPPVLLHLLLLLARRGRWQALAAVVALLRVALPVGLACVALTVSVDSLFWGRLVWPELSVLLFNTWHNRSSQWGTQPLLWYFYSALPRCLLLSGPLALAGAARFAPRSRQPLAAAAAFVLAYSCLPHKELRFVLYAVPLVNTAAAAACAAIFSNRGKSQARAALAWLACAGHLAGNVGLTCLLASAAAWNYPGGDAAAMLHAYLHSSAKVHVHLCNLAAQTGASRFLQLHDAWQYSKAEGLRSLADFRPFSHVIAEPAFAESVGLAQTCRTIGAVAAFDGFDPFGGLFGDGGGDGGGFGWARFLRLRTALLILEKPAA